MNDERVEELAKALFDCYRERIYPRPALISQDHLPVLQRTLALLPEPRATLMPATKLDDRITGYLLAPGQLFKVTIDLSGGEEQHPPITLKRHHLDPATTSIELHVEAPRPNAIEHHQWKLAVDGHDLPLEQVRITVESGTYPADSFARAVAAELGWQC